MNLDQGSTLVLVACVKAKRELPCAARELYLSDWFAKASRYARQLSPRWAILSAKHGLVPPEQVLAPYDQTLLAMNKPQRAAWGEHVLRQLDELQDRPRHCVVLAGRCYREPLMNGLEQRFDLVWVPLLGMGIGEQKSWLKGHTA